MKISSLARSGALAIALPVAFLSAALAADSPVAPGSPGRGRTAQDNARMGFDELDGRLTLQFVDALTGKPLPEARVTMRDHAETTDANGMASFPFPKVDGHEGLEPVRVEKAGYVTSEVSVHVILDTVFLHRFSISPILPPGRYRITLDWAREPRDLDAHLVKRGRYHISYRDMRQFEDQAWLDRDDLDGEGPETITVRAIDPEAEYVFFVHDFTNRERSGFKNFERSRARVQVFSETGLVRAFEVPRGAGRIWKVFTIRGGMIEPASSIVDRIE
jgi:hypothetical protein